MAAEERDGQRLGDAPEPPMGQQADDSKGWGWICGDILQYDSVGKTEVGDGRMMARAAAERWRTELGEQDRRARRGGWTAVAE